MGSFCIATLTRFLIVISEIMTSSKHSKQFFGSDNKSSQCFASMAAVRQFH